MTEQKSADQKNAFVDILGRWLSIAVILAGVLYLGWDLAKVQMQHAHVEKMTLIGAKTCPQ